VRRLQAGLLLLAARLNLSNLETALGQFFPELHHFEHDFPLALVLEQLFVRFAAHRRRPVTRIIRSPVAFPGIPGAICAHMA